MTTVLNWDLREHMHLFREEPGEGREIRLDVLINLILHANLRGRTWVSRDRIARELGIGKPRVSAALKWLFEKGAVYNVPFQYRIGTERDLEPRKYVFQLTGVVRFSDELVIPYLYLPDIESEIANTLRELADIGGEALVDFLTQGSDSEHSLFGQSSDSERSDSEHSDSEHKGSTDSKGHTVKATLSASEKRSTDEVDSYTGLSIPVAALDRGSRDGEKIVIETPKGERALPGQEEWTEFEKWLLATARKKELTEQQRGYFHVKGYYVPAEKVDAVESPTVNEAWANESYRHFVAEIILPEMKVKNMVNITGFNKWLNSPSTWKRYFAWKDEHGSEYGEYSEPEEPRKVWGDVWVRPKEPWEDD